MKNKMFAISVFLILACMEAFSQGILKSMTLKSPDGKEVVIDTLIQNEVVVLCFWSTTCKPCLSELNALAEMANRWHGKLDIWAVSIDDARSAAKVKALVNGRKWPFKVFIDQKKELFQLLNLTSIPTSLIISGQGKVVYRHIGYTPGDENVLIACAYKYLTTE